MVFNRYLGPGDFGSLERAGKAIRQRSVVRGIDTTEPGFEVLTGSCRDIEVTRPGVHFVHTFPASCQGYVSITRSYCHGSSEDSRTPGRPSCLDSHIIKGVQTQIIMDLGFAEQLVLEMVGEFTIGSKVNQPLDLQRVHF